MLILLFAAIISAALQDFIAALALMAVVIINVIIGFTQEYKAERALAALNSLEVPKAIVYRDAGTRLVLDSAELVPGDIVELETGSLVPADLRIFESVDLHVRSIGIKDIEGRSSDRSRPFYFNLGKSEQQQTTMNDFQNASVFWSVCVLWETYIVITPSVTA